MVYYNQRKGRDPENTTTAQQGKEEIMMTIKVNGTTIGTVTTNRSMTLEEAMWAIGYDITDQADCKNGYDNGVEGFYLDDDGNYSFDAEAAEICAE